MPLVIDPKQYIIGAADVYYRSLATRDAGPWSSVGATVGPVLFKIPQTIVNPGDTFNGVLQPILGMDYLSKQGAEVDFTMPQFAGANLALAVLGATSSVLPNTDAVGTPFVTTLAAAAAIGDTNIKVTAILNAVVGQWIRIDLVAGALAEYRQIDVLGTIGAGGTGISFRNPLRQAHANGVAVVQANGDGKTEIIPGTTRRQPNTNYNDWALVAQSPNDYYELIIFNAISSTQSADLSFGQDTMAAISVSLAARKDGSNLNLPSWKLRTP